MKSLSPAEVASWIGEVAGDSAVEQLASTWTEFANYERPVVTFFGAFDTGKSSILRRLLVETGQPVPEWLTISARHETFTENLVEVAGCLMRDTPGLSPGGEDARSIHNSEIAREALGLTDILLVTLNPQLSTGERPELLEVLTSGWPATTVWFLISRADEGGIDPVLDQDGFASWSARKRDELRDSLRLDGDRRILVLVPDYAGLGSFEAQPDPSVWDLSRDWDGIDELLKCLAELAGEDLTTSRAAAEGRFWRQAARAHLAGVITTLEELKVSQDVADSSFQKRDLYVKRLDSLREAAKVSLDGAVEDAIRRASNRPLVDAEAVQEAVEPALEEWWQAQQVALARLRQDAIQALNHDHEGRGWATLGSLYRTFSAPESAEHHKGTSFVPRLGVFAKEAAEALQEADRIWRRRLSDRQKDPDEAKKLINQTGKLGLAGSIATAALPVALEVASWIEEGVQAKRDRERRDQERRRVEAEVRRVAAGAVDEAMKRLDPDLDGLRDEITAQTMGQQEADALKVAVGRASRLVARGKTLLAT